MSDLPQGATQAFIIQKEAPKPHQMIKKLWEATIGKTHPLSTNNARSYCHKDFRIQPSIDSQMARMLSNMTQGTYSADRFDTFQRVGVPQVSPSYVYSLKFSFDGSDEQYNMTFTYGYNEGTQRINRYIDFGLNGILTVPDMEPDLVYFLEMHPNFVGSPLWWPEKQQKEHGVRIWTDVATTPLFRWIDNALMNPIIHDDEKTSKLRVKQAWWTMPQHDKRSLVEQLCGSSVARSIKAADADLTLIRLLDNETENDYKRVSKMIVGNFPKAQRLIEQCYNLGILKFDKATNMWMLLDGGKPTDENAIFVNIPESLNVRETGGVPEEIMFTKWVLGEGFDNTPKAWVTESIKTALIKTGLLDEYKLRKEAAEKDVEAEMESEEWMGDAPYKQWLSDAFETGLIVFVKSADASKNGIWFKGITDPARKDECNICFVSKREMEDQTMDIVDLTFKKSEKKRTSVLTRAKKFQ